jgi:predicted dehydrogenase
MKKEARLLRVGVLGCGPISQAAHFDACRKARNVALYAMCDAAEELLTAMAAVHRPSVVYRDYDAMLADPQVEAVIVAVADQFHVPLCQKAIAAGKHVFVEKPLGVTVEECEALRAQLEGSGLVLQVGTMRRFDPGYAFAQRFIQEELGELQALKAWYYDSTFRYTMTDNLQPIILTSPQARRPVGDPKSDRRRYYMLGHGSHLLDTARFLGGAIVSVRARLSEKFGAYCWFVSLEFASGCLGHVDLIIAIRGDFGEGFQVFGEHGSVQGKGYLPWYHKATEVECFSAKTREYRRPLGEDSYAYKRQLEGFADTILKGAPQQGADIDDGVAAMRAMVAVARSVETGDWVRLAEVTGGV